MALATQCPHCYTSFRVANDQLKLHAGMVRCGACKQTFNGIEHLLAPGATPKSHQDKNQNSENSTPASNDAEGAPNISKDVVDHDKTDTEIRFEAEAVDSQVKASTSPAAATTPAQQAVSNTDVTVDLLTTDSTSLTQVDDRPSSDTFESDIENQGFDATISTMSNDRSQASLLEIMNSEKVQERFNNEINSDQQSAIEALDVTDASNLSVSAETHQIDTIESIVNSNKNEDLSEDSTSTSPALPTDFDFEESDLVADSSDHLTQAITKSEIDTAVKSDVSADTPATNADATQLNTETVSQTKSSENSQIAIQAKTPQKENESEKSQLAIEPKKPVKKPGALTASLDFELSKEERESVDEIAHIHQLELETRAAVLDEATDEWSNHEPLSVQDGFIDSLKELKPILDDIGDFNTAHEATVKSNTKHQTLNDLRVSGSKTDSVADLEINSHSEQDLERSEVTPAFVLQAERAQRFGKWKQFGLGFGVFLFVLAGVAQGIYFLRSDIAAMAPQLKPQLLTICKALSCQIRLPAQKSMLEITGSELLIVNEELGMNTLSVQILNKSNTVQAWPHFDLTLKDRRGKDLLQKAFAPTLYLENKELLSKGMAANSESNHKIFFQLNGLKASDYTVEIFYP